MVSNIAVNVLGGGAEMQGMTHKVTTFPPLFPFSASYEKNIVFFFAGNVSSHDVNATEPSPQEPAAQNPPDEVSTA